eukprot:g1422.t1
MRGCASRCTPEGGIFGFFNQIGTCIGQPEAHFACVDSTPATSRSSTNNARCTNGWNAEQRETYRCCPGSCSKSTLSIPRSIGKNADFAEVKHIAVELKEETSGDVSDVQIVIKSDAEEEGSSRCVSSAGEALDKSLEACANEHIETAAEEARNEDSSRDLRRHILPYFGTVDWDGRSHLSFEYTPEGSLYDLFQKARSCFSADSGGKVCTTETREAFEYVHSCPHVWLSQIVEGIEDLVSMRMVHRNLKFENVLIRRVHGSSGSKDLCASRTLLIANFRSAVQVQKGVQLFFPRKGKQPRKMTEEDLEYTSQAEHEALRRRSGKPYALLSRYPKDCRFAPPTQGTFFPIYYTDMYAFAAMLHNFVTSMNFRVLVDPGVLKSFETIAASIIPPTCKFARVDSSQTPCGQLGQKEWICESRSAVDNDDFSSHGVDTDDASKGFASVTDDAYGYPTSKKGTGHLILTNRGQYKNYARLKKPLVKRGGLTSASREYLSTSSSSLSSSEWIRHDSFRESESASEIDLNIYMTTTRIIGSDDDGTFDFKAMRAEMWHLRDMVEALELETDTENAAVTRTVDAEAPRDSTCVPCDEMMPVADCRSVAV